MLTKMCSNEQHLHKQSLDSGLFRVTCCVHFNYIYSILTSLKTLH